jgi:hypothetical protein
MRRIPYGLSHIVDALPTEHWEEEKSMEVHLSTSTYIPPSLISLVNASLNPEYFHPVQLDSVALFFISRVERYL